MITVNETRVAAYARYEDYRKAFAHLGRTAVQRHVMTGAEWDDVMDNWRIRKFVAKDSSTGEFLGLSTITNHLEAWPLISPAYFEANYPDEYARGDVWYIGFAFATGRELSVLPALLKAMYPLSCKGISVMDFCTVNVDRGLPGYTRKILEKINPAVGMHRIDAQEFWAIDFQTDDPVATSPAIL